MNVDRERRSRRKENVLLLPPKSAKVTCRCLKKERIKLIKQINNNYFSVNISASVSASVLDGTFSIGTLCLNCVWTVFDWCFIICATYLFLPFPFRSVPSRPVCPPALRCAADRAPCLRAQAIVSVLIVSVRTAGERIPWGV